jgi:uncharacterized protein
MTNLITPRNIRFDLPAETLASRRQSDPAGALLYGALSAVFPQGERFFIESVRQHFDVVQDPKIRADITAFVRQEVNHTREHAAMNALIAEDGYDLASVEHRTATYLDKIGQRSPLRQLMFTVCLEHFTAVFAHALLANPKHLAAASPLERRIWLWHAVEEVEHKAVAFDVFASVTASWSGPRRWLFRNLSMIETLWLFLKVMALHLADLRAQEPRPERTRWRAVMVLLLWDPALLADLAPQILRFFVPGFHPWQHDDSELLQPVITEPALA